MSRLGAISDKKTQGARFLHIVIGDPRYLDNKCERSSCSDEKIPGALLNLLIIRFIYINNRGQHISMSTLGAHLLDAVISAPSVHQDNNGEQVS